MKRFVFIILTLFSIPFSFACNPSNEDTARIRLRVENGFRGVVYLLKIEDKLEKVDSLTLTSNEGLFNINVKRPDIYRVKLSKTFIDVPICLESEGDYEVIITNDGRDYIKVNRGIEQGIINRFNFSLDSIRTNVGMSDSVKFVREQELKENYLLKYPKKFAAVYFAHNLLLADFEKIAYIKEELDTNIYRHSYYYKSFEKLYLDLKSFWMVGQQAPDFTCKDINGNDFILRDLHGKKIILDFWASWCKPCRAKTRVIAKKYDSLIKEGYVVVSFSLDDKRELWEKASKSDGLCWYNLSDLKGYGKSNIAALYKVRQLPSVFLIDENGIIVSQNFTIK